MELLIIKIQKFKIMTYVYKHHNVEKSRSKNVHFAEVSNLKNFELEILEFNNFLNFRKS